MKIDFVETNQLAVPVRRRDHIQGAMNAPLTLLEYGDYECPYCSQACELVKQITETLGARLRFVFRNFPLANIHPHAVHAAEAAEAAGAQGRFWEMHELLFAHQDALGDEDLGRYATELRLDDERVRREIDAGTHFGRIRNDFKNGVRSGVSGTPTFFVNDARYDGLLDSGSLIAALNESVR